MANALYDDVIKNVRIIADQLGIKERKKFIVENAEDFLKIAVKRGLKITSGDEKKIAIVLLYHLNIITKGRIRDNAFVNIGIFRNIDELKDYASLITNYIQ